LLDDHSMNYDLVIHGGVIVDGSGCRAFRADVGISNGKIAGIGSIDPESWSSLIEAKGLALAPGFIDIHSHSDITLIVNPKAESKVRQGVTTEVVGNCGGSAAPLRGLAVDQEARRYGVKADWGYFSKYFKVFWFIKFFPSKKCDFFATLYLIFTILLPKKSPFLFYQSHSLFKY